jgi:hypothetical protein
MPLMNSSTPLLTLEQRKALIWIKEHQPVVPPLAIVPSRLRIGLAQAGLIQFDPNRRRFDAPRFCLTEAGLRALNPLS